MGFVVNHNRWHALLLWRYDVSTASASTLAHALSVEGLPYERIPDRRRNDVRAFRRLRQKERVRVCQTFLDWRVRFLHQGECLGPLVVLYQFTDATGSTFALSPATRRALAEQFPLDFHPLPRLFVAHERDEDPATLRVRLARPLFVILTGLGFETTQPHIEFRDAVTQKLL